MSRIKPDGYHRTSMKRPDPELEYRIREGDVVFSPVKSPMPVKFWNIHSIDQLKRTIMSFLEGEYKPGKVIRRIQRVRKMTSLETGKTKRWWDKVEGDIDFVLMMHETYDIV